MGGSLMRYVAAILLAGCVSAQAQGPTREDACEEYVAGYRGLEMMASLSWGAGEQWQAMAQIFDDYSTRTLRAEQPVINRLTDDEVRVMQEFAQIQRDINDFEKKCRSTESVRECAQQTHKAASGRASRPRGSVRVLLRMGWGEEWRMNRH